jgi:hypothetical protein
MKITKEKEDELILKGFGLLVIACLAMFIFGAVSGVYYTKHEASGRYDRAIELLYIDEVYIGFIPEDMRKVNDNTTIGTLRYMFNIGVPPHYREEAVNTVVDYVCDGGFKPPFNSTTDRGLPMLP